jgi:hypothetical protein
MSKRTMRTSAEPPTPPSFGGYYKNARNVAGLELQTAVETLAAVGVAGVAVYGAVELAVLWPLAVGGTATLLTLVHAKSLHRHTQDVVADLWRREMAAGRDLDGDGEIGPPKRVTRYIEIGGQMEPFVEEDEPRPAGGQQPVVVDKVPGFEMSPSDLAEIVELAEQVGLGRAKLVGTRLPSGAKFSKGDWERFTTEAARRGWIERGSNGSGGTWRVKPASVLRALRMASGTGPAVRETGRAGGVTGADRSETGLEVGKGRGV